MTDIHIDSPTHNGVELPLPTVAQCYTCNHEQSRSINSALLSGVSPRIVWESLGDSPNISQRNIADHKRAGHHKINASIVIQLMDQRAAKENMSIDEYEHVVKKELFSLEMVVDKFRARLVEPDFVPDMKEGMAAIKLLSELTSADRVEGFGPQEMFVALSSFLGHVRTVLNRYAPTQVEEAMLTLGRLLDKDPILVNMRVQQMGTPMLQDAYDDPTIIDAEEVTILADRFDEGADF